MELRVCLRFRVGADSGVGDLQVRSHLLLGHRTRSSGFTACPTNQKKGPILILGSGGSVEP
jgi:hypothetical protein